MSAIPKKPYLDRLQNQAYAQQGAFYSFQTLERRRFVMALIHNETISPERKVAIIKDWISKGWVYPHRVDSQMEDKNLTLKNDSVLLSNFQQDSFWR
jgi:hypothetical protein